MFVIFCCSRLHFDSESSIDNEVGSLSGYIMDKRIKMENTSEDEATSELIRRTSCDGKFKQIKFNYTYVKEKFLFYM